MINKIINKMTTEELENKLKINENTCIHCPTLELAKQVLNIFNKLDLKWCSGKHYASNPNWDSHKENTTYHPFNGEYSSLEFAHLSGFKIINAKEFISLHTEGSEFITLHTEGKKLIALHTEGAEFITLHTEGKEFDLESYTPKGNLKRFPKEIISRMLDCQEEQGNPRDVSIFENQVASEQYNKGFAWNETQEGVFFWLNVINNKDFNLFFEKYPKQEYQELKNNKNMQENNKKEEGSQDFRINDKVYDILLKEVGVVQDINYSSSIPYGLSVELKSGLKSYTINGCYIPEYKNPHLLHYRDDYNYDVIDFNNLPKRQEPKRWRAEKGGEYHYIRFYLEGWFCTSTTKENSWYYDNINYKSGNYFRTEAEAKIIAQKLNTHFKQLIQEEHE